MFRDLVSLLGFKHGHTKLIHDETNLILQGGYCVTFAVKLWVSEKIENEAGSADKAFMSCYAWKIIYSACTAQWVNAYTVKLLWFMYFCAFIAD